MGSSVKDCSSDKCDGTGGGDSKENSGCFTNAEYGDERDKKHDWNVKDGLHGGVCVKRGLNPLVGGLEANGIANSLVAESRDIMAFLVRGPVRVIANKPATGQQSGDGVAFVVNSHECDGVCDYGCFHSVCV